MNPAQRIVTRLPLVELWDNEGVITRERIRNLDRNDLLELVRLGPLQFVVADCGLKLDWIPIENRFEFWKKVQTQIANPEKPILLSQFPNETAYIASEWHGRTSQHLILLEKHH